MVSPSEGNRPGEERRRPLRAQRLKVALIVFTVFGLPLFLMLGYLALRDAAFDPPFDDQPGGRIAGRTVDQEGAAQPGVSVEAFTQARGGVPELLARLATDAEGRFAVEVPALDGCYVLRVGGGRWVETVKELSLVSDPFPDLDFTLRPGCELVVALERAGASPVAGGRYYLSRAGGLLGLPIPSAAVTGDFSGAEFARGGLRPGTWKLSVELEDGTKAEWGIELAPGRAELALGL